jgi:dTDP-4-dehydrorhamnose reductase
MIYKKTILVLGASGMLGSAIMRLVSADESYKVLGSVRSQHFLKYFSSEVSENIVTGVDVENVDLLADLFARVRPQVVVNCIGLIKQRTGAEDPLMALPVNAVLPHRLARLCELVGARLVHISTDCVFAGSKGAYSELDKPDADDVYGRSKLLGEVNYPHAVTLRTSIIGQELNSSRGLISWFLGMQGGVIGYTRAIFSGLPTVELARIIRDIVIPRNDLRGVYHVAADPISKFDLLQMVNKEYGKGLEIQPDDKVVIDRSLDATLFRESTGYTAPAWPELVAQMHKFELQFRTHV